MEKTAKAPNYTAEQVAMCVQEYTANPTFATVENLAIKLGKSTRSITAKLSREKLPNGESLYKAKAYTTKNGETVIKKDEHADAIGAILQLKENDIESLTKANKSCLRAIFEALANSKPVTA